MLTRSELLALTGLETGQLKARARREQLPFHYNPESATPDVEDRVGWRRYRAYDALSIIVSDEFSRNGITSLNDAAKAAFNSIGLGFDNLKEHGLTGTPVWVGLVRWQEGDTVGTSHVGGTLTDIAARVSADRNNFSLVLVNLTNALLTLLNRARLVSGDLPAFVAKELGISGE